MTDSATQNNYTVYGPDANCTLAVCPASRSVFQYRPSLSANSVFIALYGLSLIIHVAQGIKWRTWVFAFAMFWGCVAEMIGYGGRILLWENPFSFDGFLMQIICITLAPVFYTAAIYLTLSKIIIYLGPQYARFSPELYYWIFIPCDIISLILQSVGGALSSQSSGGSQPAVNTSLTGLSFQVFTLCVFIGLALEYAWRYTRSKDARIDKGQLPNSFKIFILFLSLATILILIRCIYRIDELSEGYTGDLIHNEGLFIALEGAVVLVAVYCLNVAHPGPVLGWPRNRESRPDNVGSSQPTGIEEGMREDKTSTF